MSLSVAASANSSALPAPSENVHRHRHPNLQQKFQQQTIDTDEVPTISGHLKLIVISSILLALLVATIKLITGYVGAELARAGHTTSRQIHRVIVSRDIISLPANIIRYQSQRRINKTKKLDLYLHWPTLDGYSEELKSIFRSIQISNQIIFVSLLPRFSDLDMSARIGPIYEKFLVGPRTPAGDNLVSQQLDPEHGFINEYLIVEKNNPNPFSARCVEHGSNSGSAYCIRDINIGESLSLTYRFHSDLIPQWFDLEQSIIKKFNAMIL
ncbi:MAG: hypothetical protein GY761_11920 [Hyphomicrobiales bacterium]|nr:hypothetical protein [Hyphomicrobiales bacterium]